jgi:hypothetical protein
MLAANAPLSKCSSIRAHRFAAGMLVLLALSPVGSAQSGGSLAASAPLANPAPAAAANAALVEDQVPDLQGAIAKAMQSLDGDVRIYNDHVVTLASPFMEGRLPGTRGMEIATEYVEYWLKKSGLEPAFTDASGELGYRQPFELASIPNLLSHSISLPGAGRGLEAGVDFTALALGDSGTVTGSLVFVGYSIESGPDDYASYADDDDLTGKVAVMLRFEPMDEDGKSLWTSRGPWSGRAGFSFKFRAVARRNPAAVILINTPGAADPRIERLLPVGGGGGQTVDGPVIMLSQQAGADLIESLGDNLTLMELREIADVRGGVIDLGGRVTVSAEIEREPLIAENVGGLLRGKGALADELIVIGAHLDHLGMGDFGSRSGPGELHPGADDNASGSAAVIMLAEDLVDDYAAMDDNADARSILFLCFSAEESGLNGARHYVEEPIVPLDQHALMVNFDMIGRIVNKRLSVSGVSSADGMADWLAPYFEQSSLEIVQPANMSGASDHSAFFSKDIPVLFGIIADFHDDYHTPRDVSWKINRVDAVHTINLFHEIGLAAATRAEPFVFSDPSILASVASALGSAADATQRARPEFASVGDIRVRMGIVPAQDQGTDGGVLIGDVSDGTSASDAGMLAGDRMTTWNGDAIEGVLPWLSQLAAHAPGDKVQVGVNRGSESIVLWVTLKARAGG